MIRKREKEEQQKSESKNNELVPFNGKIKQLDASKRKAFKSYQEEAIYVINLLKKQGIDIYEEGRYGGMYLHQNKGAKYKSIFQEKQENKSENNIDSPTINNKDLSDFFKQ